MSSNYLIGTRGSLLAVTQCTLIKNEIQANTNATFDLLKIKTQGDQITNKPLWQLEGKDFFTKELDEALLSKKIDLVVHSYKDLGSERPQGIKLGCITERKYPHDILLIKKDKIKNLKNMKELIVGTSSPRRIVNIESSLNKYLPNKDINVKCETLRGNVNTRIEKLCNDQYDAIVLALAGLERLANKEDSAKILNELVKDLTFMILPLKDFPASASQGALAIEHHEENKEIEPILKTVHHDQTAQEIARERKAFNSYGGGCHLAVGIHVKKVQDFFIHIHKGSVDEEKIFKRELEGHDYSSLKGKTLCEIKKTKNLIEKKPLSYDNDLTENLFVTSSHCFHLTQKANSLWAAGNKTMQKLLAADQWVCGSAEGFGHEMISNFKNSKAVQILLKNNNWKVLSHDKAQSEIGEVIASYTHQVKEHYELPKEILDADILYWSSFNEYLEYINHTPELKDKRHACGLGKTYTQFKNNKINIIPCLDAKQLEENL